MAPDKAVRIIGLVLLGLGLFMWCRPFGPNAWLGVRLPWTYADREIWDKSWRLGAFFLSLMGLGAFIGVEILFVCAGLMVLACTLYPWRLYYRKYGTGRTCPGKSWTDYRPLIACRHCGHRQCLPNAGEWATAVCETCGRPCRS